MKGEDLFLFLVCVNIAIFWTYSMGVIPSVGLPGNYTSPQGIVDVFRIENLKITDLSLLVGGSLFAGIVGILTKQYVFAGVVILIWIVSNLLGPIGMLVNGFPKMVTEVILIIGSNSAEAQSLSSIVGWVVTALYVYTMFMFFISILGQRQQT
jgi:hypothetical protein